MAASSSASRWLMNEPGRRFQIEVVSLSTSSRCTSVIESRLPRVSRFSAVQEREKQVSASPVIDC